MQSKLLYIISQSGITAKMHETKLYSCLLIIFYSGRAIYNIIFIFHISDLLSIKGYLFCLHAFTKNDMTFSIQS